MMQTNNDLRVVIGLGKTGLSCIRYFMRNNIACVVIDNRAEPPGLAKIQAEFPDLDIHTGHWHTAILQTATEIIVSPGVDLRQAAFVAARTAGISIIGDIELFMRVVRAPVIGITGSNAKGTVTTCLGEMIKQAGYQVLLGGNIGIPVLDLLEQSTPDYYVLELSSFQLETVPSLALKAGVILNISPDHLDRYDDIQGYIAAKQRIYAHSETWVVNREDAQAQPQLFSNHPSISFALDEPGAGAFGIRWEGDQSYLAYGAKKLLATTALKLPGRHNWVNALATLALGYVLELPMVAMLEVLQTFIGLPHRCQYLSEIGGVRWYDDSKATNVGAACAAITGLGATLKGKIILIAGGQAKHADFSALQQPVADYVRHTILLGEDAVLLDEALQPYSSISMATDLADAIRIARQRAEVGDAVVLAPACASFDMFLNYEKRGECFQQLVMALEA